MYCMLLRPRNIFQGIGAFLFLCYIHYMYAHILAWNINIVTLMINLNLLKLIFLMQQYLVYKINKNLIIIFRSKIQSVFFFSEKVKHDIKKSSQFKIFFFSKEL